MAHHLIAVVAPALDAARGILAPYGEDYIGLEDTDGRFDWYSDDGGRWEEATADYQGMPVRDWPKLLDSEDSFTPFAVVTRDGWTDDPTENEIRSIVDAATPDDLVWFIDIHSWF